MKNNLLISLLMCLMISIILFAYAPKILAEETCVVEPISSFDDSSSCRYTSYRGSDDNFYESCYQKYLLRKNDWEIRCFRYWDDKNKITPSTNQTPTVAPVIQNTPPATTPSPSPIKKIIKKIITPTPTEEIASSSGSTFNTATVSGITTSKNGFLSWILKIFRILNILKD
ncbi:MAG: hypothetical protein WA052_02355 [Microgenomates group bacterium]